MSGRASCQYLRNPNLSRDRPTFRKRSAYAATFRADLITFVLLKAEKVQRCLDELVSIKWVHWQHIDQANTDQYNG